MMNSNVTHKIAVGIGLAAVFGLGVSVFAVRAARESQIASNTAAAALDQNPADVTGSAPGTTGQMPADQLTAASGPPPPVASEAAPTSPAPTTGSVAKNIAGTATSDQAKPARPKASDRHVAKTRTSDDTTGTSVAPAPDSKANLADDSASKGADSAAGNIALTLAPPALAPSGSTPPAPAGAGVDAQPALAQAAPGPGAQGAATAAGSATTGDAPVASDSQITASVKSEIAKAAPASNVDVTATNGIVALAGSVPSRDAIIQIEEAAQRVPGVNYVDASALTVSNQ